MPRMTLRLSRQTVAELDLRGTQTSSKVINARPVLRIDEKKIVVMQELQLTITSQNGGELDKFV